VVFGATDIGRNRSTNEDQFLTATLRKAMQIEQCSFASPETQIADEQGYLWLVADGMGGHAGGEAASMITVEAIEEFALNTLKWFFHSRGAEGAELLLEFEAVLRQTDKRLLREGSQHPELFGMGTTATVAFFMDDTVFVLHVGDSRCYLLANGELRLVTHDHTLLETLRARGQAPGEPSAQERLSHVLTNVVGGGQEGIQVDIHRLRVQAGDQLLLCTDGLNGMVDDRAIATELSNAATPREACERLIDAANRQGGRDNITVVVARFESQPQPHLEASGRSPSDSSPS
jgi:protein phosphatase